MPKNKLLKSAAKQLSKYFLCDFRDDNVLELSYDNEHLPIAFLVVEEKFPNTIIASFSSEFNNIHQCATICIQLSRIAHTELGENFFYDPQEEDIYWGEAADRRFLEYVGMAEGATIDLRVMDPLNDTKH